MNSARPACRYPSSDNCRDPFYAYGDYDMLEVYREAVRIAQLDHPFGDWAASVASTPAASCGFAGRGRIAVGATADLVLFRARCMTELLARPQSDRIVLRGGKPIDTELPDFRELDVVVTRHDPNRSIASHYVAMKVPPLA
jgi:cytosine deaminase